MTWVRDPIPGHSPRVALIAASIADVPAHEPTSIDASSELRPTGHYSCALNLYIRVIVGATFLWFG